MMTCANNLDPDDAQQNLRSKLVDTQMSILKRKIMAETMYFRFFFKENNIIFMGQSYVRAKKRQKNIR